jgi:hypothetical protein
MAGRAKDDLITRSGAAVGVGCGIGWVVVRAKVGFDFDYSPDEDLASYAMSQELSKQAWRYEFGRVFVEGTRERSEVIPGPNRRPGDAWRR